MKPFLMFDLGIASGSMHVAATHWRETMPALAEEAASICNQIYQLSCRAIAGESPRAMCICGRTGQAHYSGEADDCPGFRERDS